jgi:hypothetical protein
VTTDSLATFMVRRLRVTRHLHLGFCAGYGGEMNVPQRPCDATSISPRRNSDDARRETRPESVRDPPVLRPSHRRNEIRPPIELSDVAGNLRADRVRYGNSSPHNEKELRGSATNLYRCIPRFTAHDPASPL